MDYAFGNPNFVDDLLTEVKEIHGIFAAGWVGKGLNALCRSNLIQRVNEMHPNDPSKQFVPVRHTGNLLVRGVQIVRVDERVEGGRVLVTQFLDRLPTDLVRLHVSKSP